LAFKQKFAISFFGIRGMGTIFYLAFAISEFNFDHQEKLWAIVSFTILVSVILHGITANWVMQRLKEKVPQEQ
jgi:NhaP-type Na+/H+ or K+/H+ antiporter